jgi:GNS1/SUR4 family
MAFLTDPRSVFFSSFLFVGTYLGLEKAVVNRGPSQKAATMMTIHNSVQVLLSLTILSLILATAVPIPWASILEIARADDASLARLVYHYSKFYEYVDIFLMAAQGKPVGLHFFFHHLTTPWFTVARVVNSWEGWQLFAGLNAFHHALSACDPRPQQVLTSTVYGYYAGASWTRPALAYTQYLQLVGGISYDAWLVVHKLGRGEQISGNLVAIGLLTSYLYLHRRDVRMEAKGNDHPK